MPLPDQRHRRQQRLEVLAPLQRRDGEHYGPPRSRAGPSGRKDGRDPRRRHADPLSREAEKLDDLARRELGVDDDQVTGPGGMLVLAGVHPVGLRVHPVRMTERNEVVDRRRADTRPLRRVHPVGEVKDVQRARKPLDGTSSQPAPGRSPPMRLRRNEDQAAARPARRRAPARSGVFPAVRRRRTRRSRSRHPPRSGRAAFRGRSCRCRSEAARAE